MATEVTKKRRSRLGTRSHIDLHGVFDRDAQVLLLVDAAELVGDRRGHFLGDDVHAGAEAVAGPQGPGHQFQRVGQLRGELLQPRRAACSTATANGTENISRP